MVRYGIFVLFLVIGAQLYAQHYPPYRNQAGKSSFHTGFVGQIGIAAGQEHFISTPKGSVFLDTGFEYPRRFPRKEIDWNSFSDIGFHVGPQLSIFVLFGGWFSYGFQGGISIKPFTFDVSFTRTIVQNPDSEVVGRDNTLNPKIGIFIGPVWIQGGPSFAMNGKSSNFNNIIRINGQPCNFELSYIIRL